MDFPQQSSDDCENIANANKPLEEWGASAPKVYHGGYRLEVDRTWTPISELAQKDEESQLLNAVLNNRQGIIRAAISMDSHNNPN